jgi:hypothetical protein
LASALAGFARPFTPWRMPATRKDLQKERGPDSRKGLSMVPSRWTGRCREICPDPIQVSWSMIFSENRSALFEIML